MYILKQITNGEIELIREELFIVKSNNGPFELIRTIGAHLFQIVSVALNSRASVSATVCHQEDSVKLWDVKQGISISFYILCLMHTGTLLQTMEFNSPKAALFFNHSPSKLIVACRNDIYIVDVTTLSILSFSDTPQDSSYNPHALALSVGDTVLVAGCSNHRLVYIHGYDTVSRSQLWLYDAAYHLGAVCMLGAHVLVTIGRGLTWELDLKTGDHVATLRTSNGHIFRIGVIEG
jgi:WD40 repeat protein